MKKRMSDCREVKKMQKVLVAVDGTKAACRALLEAKRIIEKIGGQLTVLSVVPSLDVPREPSRRASRTERFMRGVREAFNLEGISVETIIYESKDPVRAIVDLAKGMSMDFIVISSPWERAIRSSSWKRISALIAQTAPCAVLVV